MELEQREEVPNSLVRSEKLDGGEHSEKNQIALGVRRQLQNLF